MYVNLRNAFEAQESRPRLVFQGLMSVEGKLHEMKQEILQRTTQTLHAEEPPEPVRTHSQCAHTCVYESIFQILQVTF